MTCGVYKIVNSVNGKMYIGQSVDIERRWKQHKQDSKTQDNHLYRAMRKDGLDNFVFSVICEVPESALDQYEISYIKYYDTTNPKNGYNKTFGGEGCRCSDETKTKMSDAHKGKPKSDEHKMNISNAKRGKKIKPMSNETKTKMSDAHKGKTHSDEHKMNISNAALNRSDETKTKMSNAKKGNQHNLKQYLYQGIVYNGMKELADFLGLKYQTLSSRIIRKLIDVTILSQSQKN